MSLLIAWNTGCLYQRDGQKIAAQVAADGKSILFADTSRMVDGEFPVARAPRDSYALKQMAQNAYDFGNYSHCRDWQTIQALHRAAREHAPSLATAGRIVTIAE